MTCFWGEEPLAALAASKFICLNVCISSLYSIILFPIYIYFNKRGGWESCTVTSRHIPNVFSKRRKIYRSLWLQVLRKKHTHKNKAVLCRAARPAQPQLSLIYINNHYRAFYRGQDPTAKAVQVPLSEKSLQSSLFVAVFVKTVTTSVNETVLPSS
jgi:hypothetical protein